MARFLSCQKGCDCLPRRNKITVTPPMDDTTTCGWEAPKERALPPTHLASFGSSVESSTTAGSYASEASLSEAPTSPTTPPGQPGQIHSPKKGGDAAEENTMVMPPGVVMSRGSKNHHLGQCRPCTTCHTAEGCARGEMCNFCHYHHGEAKLLESTIYSANARLRRILKAEARQAKGKDAATAAPCAENGKARRGAKVSPPAVRLPPPPPPALPVVPPPGLERPVAPMMNVPPPVFEPFVACAPPRAPLGLEPPVAPALPMAPPGLEPPVAFMLPTALPCMEPFTAQAPPATPAAPCQPASSAPWQAPYPRRQPPKSLEPVAQQQTPYMRRLAMARAMVARPLQPQVPQPEAFVRNCSGGVDPATIVVERL